MNLWSRWATRDRKKHLKMNSLIWDFLVTEVCHFQTNDIPDRFLTKKSIMTTVLKCTRQILYWIGLVNEPMIVLGNRPIANTFVHTIVIISQVCFVTPFILYAIDNRKLLTRVHNSGNVIIGIILMTLIYIDLIRNKMFISQTLDLLEEIVKKSE